MSRDHDDDREDRDRPEPLPPAWCPECSAMVKPTQLDFGIGPWEMGSQKGWHHDYAIGCPDCECTDLAEEDPSTECRSCGEIEPCDKDMGLCQSCARRVAGLADGDR